MSFQNCSGTLNIVSPDDLSQEVSDYAVASFGNPGLYPIFGRIVPITAYDCTFYQPLESNSIALVTLSTTSVCYYSDLALSVQNSGGVAFIYISFSEYIDFFMVPISTTEGAKIQILSLAIQNSLGQALLSHSNEEIWVAYSYGVVRSSLPVINYYLTSNYSLDQTFFTALQQLNTDIPLLRSEFQLGFINDVYSTINLTTDCVNNYCVPTENSVTGSQKLNNSIIILNYYNSLTADNSVTTLTTFLLDLYSTCSTDYSTDCLTSVLNRYQIASNESAAILDGLSLSDSSEYAYFYINNIFYVNLQVFESAFCLSAENPNLNCPSCSGSCTYSDLYDPRCLDGCNTTSCGYDLLMCLEVSRNCYTFMIGDGNCNQACANDTDCVVSDGGDGRMDKMRLAVILIVVLGGALL